jgi:hypothetical protein
MGEKEVILDAGNHDRTFCPVKILISLPEMGKKISVSLLDAESGKPVPCQYEISGDGEALTLAWIVESLDRGKTKRYRIKFDEALGRQPPEPLVSLRESFNGQIDIAVKDQLFTSYHFGEEVIRPYLHPVVGPYGKPVTRGFPMIPNVPGEVRDHPHHRSIWVAHGDVNKVDNWSELSGHGRMVHREFKKRVEGPVYAELISMNDWVAHNGAKVLEEERRIIVYNTPPYVRMVDIEMAFHATERDVTFGDTKEGGIISVRVATSMDVARGGRIENSYGGINEAETWGKRAQWCDYSGPVDGQWVGIAIFDHTENLRHPTYWHVRNYGLMTANCFGISYFTQDPKNRGDYTLKGGEKLRLRYRLLIHEGEARQGKVRERYHDYINPPTLTVT